MEISKELQRVLELSYNEAKNRYHEFVTLEHLLYAMTKEETTASILELCGANLKELQYDLYSFIEETFPRINQLNDSKYEPKYTLGFKSLLEAAAFQAESSDLKIVSSENLLVALFKQPESHALYFLKKQNIARYDVLSTISHKPQPSEEVIDDSPKYCTNLNELVKKGQLDPLIGRTTELNRCIQVVLRRRKNNPILVGEPGVGKSAIAEGLAYHIVHKNVPHQLHNTTVYSLNMGELLSGTKFRGEFEERIQGLLGYFKEHTNTILVIDEIHTVIGAGSINNGGSDAANLLKPYLAKGEIRCIGTTTQKEFNRIFDKEEALSRRFQRIDINEPSLGETKKILVGLKEKYEKFHNVHFEEESIDRIIDLAQSQLRHKSFPDKAIDIMDDLGALIKIKETELPISISKDKVDEYSPLFMNITLNNEKVSFTSLSLEEDLKKSVFGQDEAIAKLVSYVQIGMAQLNDPEKPLGSFLFAGPTGVGKTALAKTLAECMGIHFCRFDMSEYMEKHSVSRLIGAPPGYVGYDSGGQLTDMINMHPNCVLLLDEIEKAHADIYNVLLQVMDYATLTDNNGKKADFSNVILIMTSNIGQDGFKGALGFSTNSQDQKQASLEQCFTPEFRNRLTDTIWFNSLSETEATKIVEKELNFIKDRVLKNNEILLSYNESIVYFLCQKGFSNEYGARPLKRIIESYILKPLSLELLDQKSKPKEMIISLNNDEILIHSSLF